MYKIFDVLEYNLLFFYPCDINNIGQYNSDITNIQILFQFE